MRESERLSDCCWETGTGTDWLAANDPLLFQEAAAKKFTSKTPFQHQHHPKDTRPLHLHHHPHSHLYAESTAVASPSPLLLFCLLSHLSRGSLLTDPAHIYTVLQVFAFLPSSSYTHNIPRS